MADVVISAGDAGVYISGDVDLPKTKIGPWAARLGYREEGETDGTTEESELEQGQQ